MIIRNILKIFSKSVILCIVICMLCVAACVAETENTPAPAPEVTPEATQNAPEQQQPAATVKAGEAAVEQEGEPVQEEPEEQDEPAQEEPEEQNADAAVTYKEFKTPPTSYVIDYVFPKTDVQPLEIDLFMPGNAPIAENYTENGYCDDTIAVELMKERVTDCDLYIAFIKIADPSQLRTAIASSDIAAPRTRYTTVINAAYNGIVAINGDYYYDDSRMESHIVRMGQALYQNTSDYYDMLIIDELGDMHIFLRGKKEQTEALEAFKQQHEIVNGFCFGPALVKDGVKMENLNEASEWCGGDYNNPRAAIGQLDTLTYVLVVANGREEHTIGLKMDRLADVMLELGCKQAYNLDGGNSATLAFNGQVYNTKENKERDVSDIIYFASAMQPAE